MREREREREREMGCCKNKHSHKSSVWETDSGAAAQNIGTLHTNVVLRLITVSGAASLVSTAIAVWNCQRQKKDSLLSEYQDKKDSLLRSWGLVVNIFKHFCSHPTPSRLPFCSFPKGVC